MHSGDEHYDDDATSGPVDDYDAELRELIAGAAEATYWCSDDELEHYARQYRAGRTA